ncbi:MAG: TPM domain-containing protein [Myxococcota bacterium]
MRSAFKWLIFAGLLLGLGAVLYGRIDFAPSRALEAGPSDDQAQLLGPFGVIVGDQCEALRADLGVDARVATRRAGGEPVAPLAERLFRELGVGRDAPTGGILIVLDGEGGEARVEVSYSLEGLLPDVFVSRLARDQLVPYASHRAAGMAVMDVLHFLRDRLLDGVASGELELAGELRGVDHLSKLLAGHSGGAGAQVALPSLPSHTEFKRRVPDDQRARYAPSDDPRESAAAFMRAQLDLVGDPTLELFSAGSRVMRARYPVAPYEELLRAKALERSQPLELQVRGDRAFLDSRKPAREFVPILLVREDGLWRVDRVETFKSFFFDGEGAFRLVNLASPYAEFTAAALQRSEESLAPLDLGAESIEAAIERLEKSSRARDRFRLAEILMRNCFVSAEAMPLYAEAAQLEPRNAKIVLTFADRAIYMFMPKIALDAVAGLGPEYWTNLAYLYEHAREPALAREYYQKAVDRNPRNGYARAALARLADSTN